MPSSDGKGHLVFTESEMVAIRHFLRYVVAASPEPLSARMLDCKTLLSKLDCIVQADRSAVREGPPPMPQKTMVLG